MGKKRSDHPWEGKRFPPGGWEKRWVLFYVGRRKKLFSEGCRRPLFNGEEGVWFSEPKRNLLPGYERRRWWRFR
jgi:hypothetical protein